MDTPSYLSQSVKVKSAPITVENMDKDIKSEHTSTEYCTSNDGSNLSNQKNACGTSYDKVTLDDSKINLVGGHINQIKIESKSILHKKTSLMEALQYDLIFLKTMPFDADDRQISLYHQNQELKKFIPNLVEIQYKQSINKEIEKKEEISELTDTQRQDIYLKDQSKAEYNQIAIEQGIPVSNQMFKIDYYLRLENLLEGRENANIIDLKMGTSTVTCNIIDSVRMAKRLKKDKNSTSPTLGFKVIGYVIKSKDQTIEEKFNKFPPKQKDEVPHVLRRILSWPKSENDQNLQLVLNEEARAYILCQLNELNDFLTLRSNRDIKGASILIIVDHFSRSYCCKMIDLSTIKIYDDPQQRDQGLIFGVQNLIKIIGAL